MGNRWIKKGGSDGLGTSLNLHKQRSLEDHLQAFRIGISDLQLELADLTFDGFDRRFDRGNFNDVE